MRACISGDAWLGCVSSFIALLERPSRQSQGQEPFLSCLLPLPVDIECLSAADLAPRTFFRYFPTKEEIVFWPAHRPLLAEFIAARPDDEPPVAALCHAVVDALSAFYDQDRERVLERLKLAFRTPALHPRLRQEQAISALAMAKVLAGRLNASAENLEIRAIAAAVAAALWVAVEEWQATDGRADLRTLIDRALSTVLAGDVRGSATTAT